MLLVFVALSYFISAQVDTAQVVVPNRFNSVPAQEKPYVIMISADGFRYDYVEKYNTVNLRKLAQTGVAAEALIPSFPSITFPNHWSLITGLYPAHHGVIDNHFYDNKRQSFYSMSDAKAAEDGTWYGGTPLWAVAEKQGLLTASMMWVGSAIDAGGTKPAYYYHYHEKFSPAEKVTKVVDWLKLPAEKRPHFITLYFPEVDGAGHRYGPDSPETERSVQLLDETIGALVEQVKALGLKNVNFIFVADHGMISVDRDNPISIPPLLNDKSRFDYYNSQTLLRVVVKDPAETRSVYRRLKKDAGDGYKVYLTKRFPRKLHFARRDDRFQRIGQLVLLPRAPKIFLEKDRKTSPGKHGYSAYSTPEMKAVFIAFGPAFKKGKTLGAFENVHVFPVVEKILDLQNAPAIDGDGRVARKILEK